MKVLVTDGDNRAALAITRSLGRLGHEVLVGDKRLSSLAQTSRYCRERIEYPDPVSEPDAFLDALARVTSERGVDVLIPVADITTFLITGQRDRFSAVVPCADAAVILRAADKVEIMRTAERIGVPVPKGIVVSSASDVPDVDRLGFPLVIKPWRSRVWTRRGWASSTVSFAADRAELLRDLSQRPAHEFPLLLQERIDGPGMGVFACYHDGRPVALFSHRRLRERPPWGGVSVLSESVEVDPVAREYATRLLQEIGWQGVAMVEFKQDSRDGVPKLMEINGRFWGSLQLAIDAGVDFPALLLQTVSGGDFQPQAPYRVGVRNRWFWGDVDSLLVTIFNRSAALPARRGRARAIAQFLKFRGTGLHYDNPKWDDRAPFITETRDWFRRLGRVRDNGGRASIDSPPSPSGAVKVQFVSSFDEVQLDEAGWNALVAQSNSNTVFQTHQWARSWSATYGSQHAPLLVTASDASGTRAVAPLVIDRGLSRERIVRFLGDGRADYCDFLAPSAEPQLIDSLFTALLHSGRWDRMELNNIPSRSNTLAIIRECCEREGFPMLAIEDVVCPALVIEGREADAQEILNRPSLRRKQHYFDREGTLVMRHLNRADEIAPMLDAFFDQHVERWNGSGSPSLFLTQRNREFYRELTARLAGSPWLLFTVAEFNGRPVAFHYGFDYFGTVTWYKPSFDVAFAAKSPGLTLLRHLVDYAAGHKRREIDFTVGDEEFKKRFTNTVRTSVRLQVFRDPIRFNLERARRSLRTAVKKAVPS